MRSRPLRSLRRLTHPFRLSAVLAAAATLSSCVSPIGRDHQRPDVSQAVPPAWSWQPANPVDHVPKGEWWKVFNDPELDSLVARALGSSPTVQAALARVEQARARARGSKSDFYPDIRFHPAFERQRTSGNLPTPVPVTIPAAQINSYAVAFDLSYELDLWGKIRRNVESARNTAAASAADYNQILLTLAADVAVQHFTRRALDSELAILRRALVLREGQLSVLEQRLAAGTIARTEVARARTELANTRADLAETTRLRHDAVLTLALLCGETAGRLELPESPLPHAAPPAIPAGLPAELLERRPDIAAAERLVAARNADVGAAKAAYFPSVRLTGNAGFLSSDADALLTADSRTWTLGPSLSLPITGYALVGARVRYARAAHAEAVAQYRQAVLGALRDVESSLLHVRLRAEQEAALADALASAAEAEDLVRQRYDRGLVSQIELLDAERTRWMVELRRNQTLAQRHIATVRLIKSLGGGWGK